MGWQKKTKIMKKGKVGIGYPNQPMKELKIVSSFPWDLFVVKKEYDNISKKRKLEVLKLLQKWAEFEIKQLN